jgi:fibronectin type 3 domain-containing protein
VQHSVDLSWKPSPSQVIGYYVYRGLQQDALSKLTGASSPSTTYTDSTVTSGLTYFYAVTSVDSSNIESAQSNQITVTIPTP